jgi:Anaphase promoting complex subunit 8 / Cdc23
METEVKDGIGDSMSIDSKGEGSSGLKVAQVELDRETQDLPKYLLGKSYFDCKEYDRAAYVLDDSQSLKSKFLRLYSKYLVGEKRKEEDGEEILGTSNFEGSISNSGPTDTERTPNKEVGGIIQELEDLATDQSSDAFILYLYIPLTHSNKDSEPHEYETTKQTMRSNHYSSASDGAHISGAHGKNSPP